MGLNIALVGSGWFAEKHGAILAGMEGVRVGGVCGTTSEKAERLAAKFDQAAGFAQLEEMLDTVKPDAVYICVPPFAHGSIELALVERSIPFFVEKPLAADLDTPTAVLKAVASRKLLTSVGYHFRYMDGTTRARSVLAERTAGMALGYWNDTMPGVYWWRKMEGSGGQFMEQTTHIVDLLRYTLGEVEEVYAAYANRYKHLTEEGVTVPDVGTVTMKLASGAVATISNTCMLPSAHMAGLQIYTNEGVLELTGSGLKDSGAGALGDYPNRTDPYTAENNAFIHALRTGDTSGILSTYEDAWKSQQLTWAANESARTGQPIRLA